MPSQNIPSQVNPSHTLVQGWSKESVGPVPPWWVMARQSVDLRVIPWPRLGEMGVKWSRPWLRLLPAIKTGMVSGISKNFWPVWPVLHFEMALRAVTMGRLLGVSFLLPLFVFGAILPGLIPSACSYWKGEFQLSACILRNNCIETTIMLSQNLRFWGFRSVITHPPIT